MLSLVAIIAIYREGGILKRLRATPLRPLTRSSRRTCSSSCCSRRSRSSLHGRWPGRRYYPVRRDVPLASFTVALLFSTVAISSMGFVIASLVPTARFAQPIGTLILYPMLGLVGAVRARRGAAAGAARDRARRCRSPTPSRCCAASGTARAGSRTPATWRRSRRSSSSAPPSPRGSSAGSDRSKELRAQRTNTTTHAIPMHAEDCRSKDPSARLGARRAAT